MIDVHVHAFTRSNDVNNHLLLPFNDASFNDVIAKVNGVEGIKTLRPGERICITNIQASIQVCHQMGCACSGIFLF